MPFKRIAIVGTGLIGRSLGVAFRRMNPAPHVVGFDLSRDNAMRAAREKATDVMVRSLGEAAQGSDLIVISVPVRAIRSVLQDLAPLVSQATVITDTGSTKREVLAWAEEYLPTGVAFVGGHPMAGKLTSGPDDEAPIQFAETIYCLTPSASAAPTAVEGVAGLVEAIGAVPYFLDPEEHDSLVAAVSHVPYLASVAMMCSAAGDPSWREMSVLAAGGFSAATRLVEADAKVFADICLTNRHNVARHLGSLIAELERLRTDIESGDEDLEQRFTRAQEDRLRWLAGKSRGTEPPSGLRDEDLKMQSLFLPRGLFGRREPKSRNGEQDRDTPAR
jgi:prephenate dehydrogenase